MIKEKKLEGGKFTKKQKNVTVLIINKKLLQLL